MSPDDFLPVSDDFVFVMPKGNDYAISVSYDAKRRVFFDPSKDEEIDVKYWAFLPVPVWAEEAAKVVELLVGGRSWESLKVMEVKND